MRRFSAFAAALVAAAAAAGGAQAVQHRDVRTLDDLLKRAQDQTSALTAAVSQASAGGDAQALDCLETLREASNQVTDQLQDVDDVAAEAASLHRLDDRRFGSAATGRAVARALTILPVETKQANQTAGLCLAQADVQARAKDLTQLIEDVTAALEQLEAKLAAKAKAAP
jgi:hypothetical protein